MRHEKGKNQQVADIWNEIDISGWNSSDFLLQIKTALLKSWQRPLGLVFVHWYLCPQRINFFTLLSLFLQKFFFFAVLFLPDSDVNHFAGGSPGPKTDITEPNLHDKIYVELKSKYFI